MAPEERVIGSREADAEHFRSRAWGFPAGAEAPPRCLFTGRAGIVSGLSAWLAGSPGDLDYLRVLTGSPGSGKSAVLGAVVCSAHPALRSVMPEVSQRLPAQGRPPLLDSLAIVHARDLTTCQVLGSVADQLGLEGSPGSGGWAAESLVRAMRPGGSGPVVVLDALDEATMPAQLAEQLTRVSASGAARVLIGVRSWRDPFAPLLDLADAAGGLIDLDDVPEDVLRSDLAAYLEQLLAGSRHYQHDDDGRLRVAAAAAEMLAAQGRRLGAQFLAAGLFAAHLNALPAVSPDLETVRAMVPVSLDRLLELGLARPAGEDPLLRPVLAVVAHAKGAGMPQSLIRHGVRAFADSPDARADPGVTQSLEAARFYLRRGPGEGGTVLYRLFHQAFDEQLISHPAGAGQPATDRRAAAGRLLDALLAGPRPGLGDGGGMRLAWDRVGPYLHRYAIEHAADAGRVDELLADPEFLVHAATGSVLEHLADAESDEARAWGAVYRVSAHRHRSRPPDVRRDMLSLDASRWGMTAMSRQLASPPWGMCWATGTMLDSALLIQLAGHEAPLAAVAAAVVNGRAIAITGDQSRYGGHGGELRFWDLLTGDQIGLPHAAHAGAVQAIAVMTLDDQPVAVTTGNDATVRVWDLASCQPVRTIATSHTQWVTGLACTTVNGRPAAVTISMDNTIQVRDLTTGEQIGEPLAMHGVQDVAATDLDGRPVIIAVGHEDEAQIWDAETGQPAGEPLVHEADYVAAVTTTTLHSRPVAITSTRMGVHIWDLSTRQPAAKPLISGAVAREGNPDLVVNWSKRNPYSGRMKLAPVHAMAATTLGGQPVVVTPAGQERRPMICAWDLETGEQVGRPLAGHTRRVRSLATIPLHGTLAAVSAADDEQTARVWDLGDRPSAGKPIPGRTGTVVQLAASTANGREIIIAAGYDRVIRIWDGDTGEMLHDMITGDTPVKDIAMATIHGRSVLIIQNVASSTPALWDLGTRQPIGFLAGHEENVNGVAATTVNGRPVAVTTSDDRTVRVWDLDTQMQIGEPLTGHTSQVGPVATATLSGIPIAVTFGRNDITLRAWNLRDMRPIGPPIDHGCAVDDIATANLGGSPVAVTTGGRAADLLLWDLAHGRLLCRIPTGHTPDSDPIAITAEGHAGLPLAITASRFDYTVRVIDLTTGEAVCRPLEFPDRPTALATTPRKGLVIGFGPDIALLEPLTLLATPDSDGAPTRSPVGSANSQPFMPPTERGRDLVPSQGQHRPSELVADVTALDEEEAVEFLLTRTGSTHHTEARHLARDLGGLPLALEQAVGYIRTTGTTLAAYLALFRERRDALPSQGDPAGLPRPVAATSSLAAAQLDAEAPGAAGLLNLLACCAPEPIPLGLLLSHANLTGCLHADIAPWLTPLLGDPIALNDAIAALHRYSLTTPAGPGLVQVHRPVQNLTLARIPENLVAGWRQAAATLIDTSVPADTHMPDTWPVCAVLLPHVQAALGDDSTGMERIANYVGHSGSYAAALDMQQRIASARQRILGPEHPGTLAARASLAHWTGEAGDRAGARDLYAVLLPVEERVLGPEHPDTLASRHELARWTGDAGDPTAARDMHAVLLAVEERVLGPEHRETLATRQELARWTGDTGDPTGARDMHAVLLPVVERVLGPEHPDTLVTRHELARWTLLTENPSEAHDLYAALLATKERVLGPEHPATLAVRHDLIYLSNSSDPAAARDQFMALLAIMQRTLGPEHPSALATRANLANRTGLAGDPAGARDLYAALLPAREQVLGPEHPATLATRHEFAHWTGLAGDPAGARDLYAGLLPARERVSGPEHPHTLAVRQELAHWTNDAGDPAGARDLYATLLAIQERLLGPEHPSALETRANLANWTGQAGDPAGARDLYAELLSTRERVLGTEHVDTLVTLGNLASWTGEAGDPGAARDQFASLLPAIERICGPEDPDTLAVHHELARWTGLGGDPVTACNLYSALLPVRERVSGPEHPDTLSARQELAHWTGMAGDPASACRQFAALQSAAEQILGPEHPDTLAIRDSLAGWMRQTKG
jgi:WD40 repeat protein